VHPAFIVETEVPRERHRHLARRGVGVEVNLFVLHAAPQPLDKHIGVSSQLRRLGTIRADVSE
jgi:hypothetical protein